MLPLSPLESALKSYVSKDKQIRREVRLAVAADSYKHS